MQGFPGTEDAHPCSIRRPEAFPLRAWREKEILVGIFDGFGKKEEKPKADFSNVQSGSSTTAPAPAAPVPDLGPASGTAGSEQSYTVVAGDSLSKIAKHFYRDANKWPRIHEANRDQIKNPDLIYPGQKLRIPTA
jgi:LysM domain-containing protein